jgi:hypothetical protein
VVADAGLNKLCLLLQSRCSILPLPDGCGSKEERGRGGGRAVSQLLAGRGGEEELWCVALLRWLEVVCSGSLVPVVSKWLACID